jgi:sec-independent protein translocase protein TatB
MFDFGFSEILVIAVVALIVIGPERLPAVARTLGHLMGRMQRYVNDVKADIQREVELDELRKLRKDVEDSARSIEDSLTAGVNTVQDELRGLEPLVNADAENARQSPAAPPSAVPAAQSGAEAAAPAASTPKNA